MHLPHGPAAQTIVLEVVSGLAGSALSNEQGGIMVRFPFPWATGMATLVDISRTSVPQGDKVPGALFVSGWEMGATLCSSTTSPGTSNSPPSFCQEPSESMASTSRNVLGHLAVNLPLQFESRGYP
jgi:hypothetical protein